MSTRRRTYSEDDDMTGRYTIFDGGIQDNNPIGSVIIDNKTGNMFTIPIEVLNSSTVNQISYGASRFKDRLLVTNNEAVNVSSLNLGGSLNNSGEVGTVIIDDGEVTGTLNCSNVFIDNITGDFYVGLKILVHYRQIEYVISVKLMRME